MLHLTLPVSTINYPFGTLFPLIEYFIDFYFKWTPLRADEQWEKREEWVQEKGEYVYMSKCN